MNKDQMEGQIKEAKGKVKEAAGKVLGDKTMEHRGKLQNAVGKLHTSYGDVREQVKKGS